MKRKLRAAERRIRELQAGLEGSPIAAGHVANRPALAEYRARAHDKIIGGVNRWFELLGDGDWDQATFDGVNVVGPDLAGMELGPSTNPEVIRAVDDLRRFFTDPDIAAGLAEAATSGVKLDSLRDDVVASVVDAIYRRGNWRVYQDSHERIYPPDVK